MSEQGPPPTGDPRPRARPRRSCARTPSSSGRSRVEDMIAETIGPLLNIGTLRAGLDAGQRGRGRPRPAAQGDRGRAGAAAAHRAPSSGREAAAVKGALSNLQMAYAQLADRRGRRPEAAEGEAPPTGPGAGAPGQAAPSQAATRPGPPEDDVKPGEPGPAQRSGRLWVPGPVGRADTAAGTLRRAPAGGAPRSPLERERTFRAVRPIPSSTLLSRGTAPSGCLFAVRSRVRRADLARRTRLTYFSEEPTLE